MTWRYILGQLHLWIGLVLCIPLVLIGITGSILVFEHEIEALFAPAGPRATVIGEPRPIGDIVAAAEAAAPPGQVARFYRAPQAEGEPARVSFGPPGQAAGPGGARGTQILIDPVTLAVLGADPSAPGLMRQIIMLHANLLVPGREGRGIVGWLGIVMLVLGASGLVLWWPRPGRWRQSFTVKWSARGLRLNRDLHGAVGIWGLAVFLVVSFSGVYLAFPQSTGAVIRAAFPARDLRGAVQVQPMEGGRPIAVAVAVERALAAIPDGEVQLVGFPARPDQPFRINLARSGQEAGTPTATVFVDPWTGAVAEIRDPRDYSVGEIIMAWQHALHAGHGLGPVYKILVFLSGLLPLLFGVTGVSMWLLRRRRRRANQERLQRAAAE
jgi:uncharacterized iron-regulated membrane protein